MSAQQRSEWMVDVAATVLFVSVSKSFELSQDMADLERASYKAWAISIAKAALCDRLVAVFDGQPIGAWSIQAVFTTDETYKVTTGDLRHRIGLALGDPLPVLPAYRDVPALRRGVATVAFPICRRFLTHPGPVPTARSPDE